MDMPPEHERAQSAEEEAPQETPGAAGTPPEGRHGRLHRRQREQGRSDKRRTNLERTAQRSSVRQKLHSTDERQFTSTGVGAGLPGTHQDGQNSAQQGGGRRDGGEDGVLKLLNQPSCHGGARKVCLLQQLQLQA